MAFYNPDCLSAEELSCPICFEEYDNIIQNRNPKLLLCLHTFCLHCIENLRQKDGTLQCSICRTIHKNVGISELFDNYVISDHLRKQQVEQDERFARDEMERLRKLDEEEHMNILQYIEPLRDSNNSHEIFESHQEENMSRSERSLMSQDNLCAGTLSNPEGGDAGGLTLLNPDSDDCTDEPQGLEESESENNDLADTADEELGVSLCASSSVILPDEFSGVSTTSIEEANNLTNSSTGEVVALDTEESDDSEDGGTSEDENDQPTVFVECINSLGSVDETLGNETDNNESDEMIEQDEVEGDCDVGDDIDNEDYNDDNEDYNDDREWETVTSDEENEDSCGNPKSPVTSNKSRVLQNSRSKSEDCKVQ